ncbi:type VII secretion protein EssC [Ligilactobacillus sp. LYQ60]|uniref:type VII secretion protein EssC n=1 Tax=Ligilactobacillus sp. LYQ60 TaxID=3378799 RepID=UPI0038550789
MDIRDFFTTTHIIIANRPGADVQVADEVELQLTKPTVQANWTLHILRGDVAVNYFVPQERTLPLGAGSVLQFGTTTLVVYPDELQVLAGQINSRLTRIKTSHHALPANFPEYHRAPRLIKRPPTTKITVDNPPAPVTKNNQGLLRSVVPALAMVGVSIVMALMRANGMFMLFSVATTGVTVIFSIVDYFRNRKDYKKKRRARKAKYLAYYDGMVKQIYGAQRAQRAALEYHYPDPATVHQMAVKYSPRIYEKRPQDFDFLTYRLGFGTVAPSAPVELGNSGTLNLDDELIAKAYQLVQQSQHLPQMPITTDLVHGPVGYVGPKKIVVEQLQWMLTQIATFHSYHDVRFIVVFNEEDYDQWAPLRWLRQLRIPELNMWGLVYNRQSRDQLMNFLHQVMKERQNEVNTTEEGESAPLFSPHYVLVVVDEDLILDHAIMEFVGGEPEKYGVSLVYVKDVLSQLPENITTVVDMRDRQTGELVMERGELKQQRFHLDHLTAAMRDLIPRKLGGLEHQETLHSSVPDQVTFLGLYGVTTIDELHIPQRWQEHSPYKSLAVPLGVSGPDEQVALDLHERAHGPHGLIAGTTGSGKSELIQSYILSLAVNFHPYDVAFLLIDYKGGGMANLFRDLPHLVGTITNLDKAQSMRALESINAELRHRQELFAKYDVNHINQYQKLFKDGTATEPMPHLFMISDEFAELKAEQPEFMDELISTARIGRSLGVHLILATQKPAGVVNDQIWSNSNFKISLKVSDKADSQEVLHTPDAAMITQPGRAYLEVGNNELYELFQSAWSGADYRPEQAGQQTEQYVIKRLDKMGQPHIISNDLSGLDQQQDVSAAPTQLEAVVADVAATFKATGDAPLKQPWLPPLRERIMVDELRELDRQTAWQRDKQPLTAVIGQVDIPSQQAQRPLTLNLSEDGNAAIFAAGGYGKSTLVQTLVMELTRSHTPEQLNFYLLDFGTNGLLPLKDLPHVADTITLGEDEKIRKMIVRINRLIKERQALLSEAAVANLAMYEEKTNQVIPDVVVIVDNFDSVGEMKFGEQFLNAVTKLAREGSSIGLHLVTTAATARALHNTLLNNIKQRLMLRQNNRDDIIELLGATKMPLEDIPGRALIKTDTAVRSFQVALPVDGETDLEVVNHLQEEVAQMNKDWIGERPEPIPMMKDQLTADEFFDRKDVQQVLAAGKLPLGLDYEEVKPVVYDPDEAGNILLVGEQRKPFNILKKHLIASILKCQNIKSVFIGTSHEYASDGFDRVISKMEEVREFIESLLKIMRKRMISNDKSQFEWIFIYIDDSSEFVQQGNISMKEYEDILKNGIDVHVTLLIAGENQQVTVNRMDEGGLYHRLIKTMTMTIRRQEQRLMDVSFDPNEEPLKKGDAYYELDREFVKFKIPEL